MKKIKLLFLSIMFPALMFSQGGVELVPFAGYMFGGSVKYSYYYGNTSYQPKLDIGDGLNYGLSILVPVQSLVDLELNWTRMDKVKAVFTTGGYPGYNQNELYVSTNYFQIGGISKFYNGGGMAQPFGSFSLGATWFDTSPTSESDPTISYEDVWKFSIMLGLGVKFMFSERVGIMLRGRLMMPMTYSGAGFYVGTGGSGMTMNSWVQPLQGDFNGGLIIKLGGN